MTTSECKRLTHPLTEHGWCKRLPHALNTHCPSLLKCQWNFTFIWSFTHARWDSGGTTGTSSLENRRQAQRSKVFVQRQQLKCRSHSNKSWYKATFTITSANLLNTYSGSGALTARNWKQIRCFNKWACGGHSWPPTKCLFCSQNKSCF